MQIHPIHEALHRQYDLTDPVQNLEAAWSVYQWQGWRAWSCAL
jgi:hypothetical protein